MVQCRSNSTKPPAVAPCDTDFSQLRVHYAGRKVFVIRWSAAVGFKVVHYDQGDWERTLRAWAAPVHFD
jgi:hypothetical protein